MRHRIVHLAANTGVFAKASFFAPNQPTDPLGPAANMAEPRQGLMLRGTRTGEFVSAWVGGFARARCMYVRHFVIDWKE